MAYSQSTTYNMFTMTMLTPQFIMVIIVVFKCYRANQHNTKYT